MHFARHPLYSTLLGSTGNHLLSPDQAVGMARTRSAARFPERTDPSIVAGNPVSVQSPARNRFLQLVDGPGRSAFCSGVASNVARRSRTICQGGNSPCTPAALQISRQIA